VDSPTYNFCKSTSDGAGDVDWFKFSAAQGEELLLAVPSTGGGAKFTVSLYDQNSKYYRSWTSTDFAKGITLRWKAPESLDYYVEIKPAQAGLFGTDMTYQVWIGPGNWISLPWISWSNR
jgi:hypothetical protein